MLRKTGIAYWRMQMWESLVWYEIGLSTLTAKISAKLGASQVKQQIEEIEEKDLGVLVVHDCEPPL